MDDGAPLTDALRLICEVYESSDPDARCSIALLDAEGQAVIGGAVARLPSSFASSQEGGVHEQGRGTAIVCANRRQAVTSSDLSIDPLWICVRDEALALGLRAAWSIPISAGTGNLVGVFTGYRAHVGEPSSAELKRSEYATTLVRAALAQERTRSSLLETRTRLELAQEIASLGYWERDVSTRRFVITPEVGRLIGADATSAIDVEQLLERVVETDRHIIIGALTEVSEHRRQLGAVEFRVKHSSRGIRHVIVQRKAIRNSDGHIIKVIGTVQDVTEEREAALRLQQSEERFRMMAEHTGQLILDCRLDVGEVHCAGAVREILGTREALAGPLELDVWRKVVHPEDVPVIAQAIRRVLHGERVSVACRIQRLDGEVLHVDVTGSAILDERRWATRIIATVSNISDRRRAEAERQRYLAQLAFLADAARKVNSVVSVTELMKIITDIARDLVNARLAIGKLAPSEASQKPVFSVSATDQYGSIETSNLCDAAPPVEGVRTSAVRFPRAAMTDDEQQDLRALLQASGMLIVPLLTHAGEVHGELHVADKRDGDFGPNDERVLGQLADLAAVGIENAQLYAELEARVGRRTRELEQSNRELEAFSYSVSHDLRGPLRAISGFAGLLREHHYEHFDADGQHYLDRIEAGTVRMSGLIDDLLELARVTRMELRRELVDLSALAEATMGRVRERAPERRSEIIIEPDLKAMGDPRLLEVMLENLFDNAWKFTGGKPVSRIRFGVREVGTERAFFVEDNGVGFDPSYANNLFGVFQRLHSGSDFPGTGVGLATVQRIVQRHGGSIWAEAAVDQGAVFYFTIAGE
jgi:PAS domain S-box-containing protein